MTSLDSIKKELAYAEKTVAVAKESVVSQQRALAAAASTHDAAAGRRNMLRLRLRYAEAAAARAQPGFSIDYNDSDPLNPLVSVNGQTQARFDSILITSANGATEIVFMWRGKQIGEVRHVDSVLADSTAITLGGFTGYQAAWR